MKSPNSLWLLRSRFLISQKIPSAICALKHIAIFRSLRFYWGVLQQNHKTACGCCGAAFLFRKKFPPQYALLSILRFFALCVFCPPSTVDRRHCLFCVNGRLVLFRLSNVALFLPLSAIKGQKQKKDAPDFHLMRLSCPGQESNLHGQNGHYPLKVACLPIPPPGHKKGNWGCGLVPLTLLPFTNLKLLT